MRIPPWRHLAVFAAIALTAGCGGRLVAGTPIATGPPASQPSSSPSKPTSASPSTSRIPGTDGTTKPDSTLSFGSQAVVPFKYTEEANGTLGLTVNSIDKGDPADLTGLKLGERAKGLIPYYLKATVENLSGNDLSYIEVTGSLDGVLPDGSNADYVLVYTSSDFPKCPNTPAPRDFTAQGATFTTCRLALAPQASAVTAAKWRAEPYSSSHPIVWK